MTLTIREYRKYSNIQRKTAEWVAERIVYICKSLSKEIKDMSLTIRNQKEVFEKEHKIMNETTDLDHCETMTELVNQLSEINMSKVSIKPNLTEKERAIIIDFLSQALRSDSCLAQASDEVLLHKFYQVENKAIRSQIITYKIEFYENSILSHIGLAYNRQFKGKDVYDAFCAKIGKSMVDYFNQFNITIIFDTRSIDVRTNGIHLHQM